MDKPNLNYIIIGSPKCGTTSFCELLGQHPEVFITNPKEPLFFSQALFLKKHRNWEWYSGLFADVKDEKAIGEGTVNYTCSDYRQLADPETIHTFYPHVRLIYMVRNPIKRIESHWLHHSIMGWPADLPDFDTAVRNHSMFLNTSRYWSHINRYRRFFPDEQIHVVFFEEFIKDPNLEMKKVFEFLGVDTEFKLTNVHQPRNQSNQEFMDGSLMRIVRKSKLLMQLKSLSPKLLKTYLLPIFKDRNTGHPEWQPGTLNWAINELQDDSLRFLEYCNKPQDFWKFRP
ncbi:MAG: sulfotransferase family protein [Dolichospermum sp.]